MSENGKNHPTNGSALGLPDLPESWIWTTLGTVADVRLGKMLSPKAYEAGLIQMPYLRNENIRWGTINFADVKQMGFKSNEIERYQVRPGDLVVCEGGEPGRCAVLRGSDGEWMYQKALHRVRFHGGLMKPTFVQLCLEYFVKQGIALPRMSETTIKHLPLEKMQVLPIPLAPLPEQHRIVSEVERQFSLLDAAVEALKRVQAKLKRYRASVLHAACTGRLVPTEAELARAQGRTYESGEALLARSLAERHFDQEHQQLHETGRTNRKTRYVEPTAPDLDGLRGLPEGWTYCSALQVCELITNGDTPAPGRMTAQGEIPFIKVYNLTRRGALDYTVRPTFISRDTHEHELRRSRIVPGDILMNIVGPPLGKVSVVPSTFPEWNTNQAVTIFRPVASINRRYLAICLLTDHVLAPLIRTAKATAGQYNIALSKCRTLPLPLPPRPEQDRIVAEVERRLSVLDEMENTLAANLKRAERLRQAILKRAFEGKLVPQDSDDEPASVLLERIRAERAEVDGRSGKRRGPGARRGQPVLSFAGE